jgi:hypothetical protein
MFYNFCPFYFDANTVHVHIVKSLGIPYSVPLQNYVKLEGVFRTVMKMIIQYCTQLDPGIVARCPRV